MHLVVPLSPNVVYRPEAPEGSPPFDYRGYGWYLVSAGADTWYAYHPAYYPTVDDVVAHLLAGEDPTGLIIDDDPSTGRAALVSLPDEFEVGDFVIWQNWTLALVYRASTRQPEKLQGDPESGLLGRELPPGWPTREEWLADGADRIILRKLALRR